VVVDDLEHVRHSGDGKIAAAEGLAEASDVAELWQVLQDPSLGRPSDQDRVLFKSVGTAEQDIALAALVMERAQTLDLGETIDDFPSLRPIQRGAAAAPSDPSGAAAG
jgi:alanine dehydrogenase